MSTIVGFGGWAHLMKIYGTAPVSPFALLVPVFGAFSARFFLGETFSSTRLLGMILIVGGLAVLFMAMRRQARVAGAACSIR